MDDFTFSNGSSRLMEITLLNHNEYKSRLYSESNVLGFMSNRVVFMENEYWEGVKSWLDRKVRDLFDALYVFLSTHL